MMSFEYIKDIALDPGTLGLIGIAKTSVIAYFVHRGVRNDLERNYETTGKTFGDSYSLSDIKYVSKKLR